MDLEVDFQTDLNQVSFVVLCIHHNHTYKSTLCGLHPFALAVLVGLFQNPYVWTLVMTTRLRRGQTQSTWQGGRKGRDQ